MGVDEEYQGILGSDSSIKKSEPIRNTIRKKHETKWIFHKKQKHDPFMKITQKLQRSQKRITDRETLPCPDYNRINEKLKNETIK